MTFLGLEIFGTYHQFVLGIPSFDLESCVLSFPDDHYFSQTLPMNEVNPNLRLIDVLLELSIKDSYLQYP